MYIISFLYIFLSTAFVYSQEQLETIVRIIRADNSREGYASDYDGLAVLVETRVKSNSLAYQYGSNKGIGVAEPGSTELIPPNVKWFAECCFRAIEPSDEGKLSYGRGKCTLFYGCPGMEDTDRVAAILNGAGDTDDLRLKRCRKHMIRRLPNGGNEDLLRASYHADLMRHSIFEWVLPEPLQTVNDLKQGINHLRIPSGRMPYYSMTGHTTSLLVRNEEVTNCVGFSVMLLKELGLVNADYNPYYDYSVREQEPQIDHRQSKSRTIKYGVMCSVLTIGCGAIGGIFGSLLAPGPGTAAGTAGGAKLGAVIAGVLIGAVVTGSGGVHTTRSAYQSLKAEDVLEGLFHYCKHSDNAMRIFRIGEASQITALERSSFRQDKNATYNEMLRHRSNAYQLDGIYRFNQ